MFKCHICSSPESHVQHVNEVFEVGNKFCLVENILAKVCSRCGEELFSSETTETIGVMLNGKTKPIKPVVLNVFSYQQEIKAS